MHTNVLYHGEMILHVSLIFWFLFFSYQWQVTQELLSHKEVMSLFPCYSNQVHGKFQWESSKWKPQHASGSHNLHILPIHALWAYTNSTHTIWSYFCRLLLKQEEDWMESSGCGLSFKLGLNTRPTQSSPLTFHLQLHSKWSVGSYVLTLLV